MHNDTPHMELSKVRFLRQSLVVVALVAAGLLILNCLSLPAFAQSGLEGRINQTIDQLIRIVNVLIAGFVVWAGFLIAKGENSGFQRLIYGVIGLIVANASYVIINYFS